jgi:hypothetical protein
VAHTLSNDGRGRGVAADQDRKEFFAAEPADMVVLADRAADTLCRFGQHRVAGQMP